MWLNVLPIACQCRFPRSRAVGVGSVWECDTCYRQWKYVGPPDTEHPHGRWRLLPDNERLPSPNQLVVVGKEDVIAYYEAILENLGWMKVD